MSQTSDLQITVCGVGISDTEKVILRVASGILKEQRKIEILQVAEPQNVTLALIDMDSDTGREYYEEYAKKNKQQYSLLLCQEALDARGARDIVLTKPLRVQVLVEVVDEVKKLEITATNKKDKASFSMSQLPANAVTAEAITAAAENEPAANAPSLFLTLLDAQIKQQAVQIFYSGRRTLFINPCRSILASASPPQVIMGLTREQDSIRIQSVPISQEDFELLAKGHIVTPLNDVLWNSAIFGSRGRLIKELSNKIPVRLKAWPNLTRVDFHPAHMQIAAILGKQALSLDELQQKTQFPIADLAAFLNAAWAVRLLDTHPAPSTGAANTPKGAAKSNLLAKIARRLNISTSSS